MFRAWTPWIEARISDKTHRTPLNSRPAQTPTHIWKGLHTDGAVFPRLIFFSAGSYKVSKVTNIISPG
jgi:hypothetical protein